MNLNDKNQIVELLKGRSTQIKAAYQAWDAAKNPGRTYGPAFREAQKRNDGYSKVTVEIYYKHNEAKVVGVPNLKPTLAEDPFNPEFENTEAPTETPIQKTCGQCGHSGTLVVYLECPTHGKFT